MAWCVANARVVSIHARQQTSGRRMVAPGAWSRNVVSIHARQQTSGRRKRAPPATPCALFQSTPANKPAGDEGFTVFSQHADMFQSTPANKPAGDAHDADEQARIYAVSIHARQQTSGRRIFPRYVRDLTKVSIHARQQTSGRQRLLPVRPVLPAFQSTPANKPAGDSTQPSPCRTRKKSHWNANLGATRAVRGHVERI